MTAKLAVDGGGPAWLVSTTARTDCSVAPHWAVTVCWPRGTETVTGVWKLPLPSATVLPAGVLSISSCTAPLGMHPCPETPICPPGGTERWSSRRALGSVVGGGGVVVLVVVEGAVVVGATVVDGVVGGGSVAGGSVAGGSVAAGM